MKKEDIWDTDVNPDGISNKIELNSQVFDRGYSCHTDDGVWYEVYVNETIKNYYPKIDLSDEEDKEKFGTFHDLMLDHYESDNQITFFVPNEEEKNTLDELFDIFV